MRGKHLYPRIFCIALMLLSLHSSQATLYTNDFFNYPAGNLSTAAPWSGAGSNLKMIAGDLTYGGLFAPSPTPTNSTKAQTTASSADGKRTFHTSAIGGPATTESIYVSFLLRQTTLAASSGPLLALSDATAVGSGGNGALVLYLNKIGSLYQVGVKKNGSAVHYPASGNYAVNDTVLVVARYKFNSANTTDDSVTLWVNPVLDGFEPSAGTTGIAATTASGAADYSVGLQYVHLRSNSSTASGVNEVDDIRIGSTWADVTPTGIVAPPVANPQPRITESFFSTSGLVLRGTNGVTNGVYQVLSSTAIAVPITNWPAIATNLFDANGNFDCTNQVSPTDAQRFYRLLIGGQIVFPPGDTPNITTQPTNLVVLAGQTASFYATANGTAPLAFQWFFNTNILLANAMSSTLTITNAQEANEGSYSLRVTNSAGSVTSIVATLTVNSPPSISSQPQSQTVTVSNTATFTVVAAGDTPLRYQWYFNTNTVLIGATNAALVISNASASNAGVYRVTVTNAFGTATSDQAQLQIAATPPSGSPEGYATRNSGTTGGAGGVTVTVNSFAEFEHYVGTNQPCVIQVSGTINLGSSNVRVRDNKTIVGLGTNAMLIGDLKVFGNNNVIIRNLTLSNPGVGDNDGLTLQECLNVWVDHCTFVDCDDGSLDISHGADWITVSWCHFYYTNPANTHRFANLVGHSDSSTAEAEDTGKLHVTYHHNWWGQLVHERMPRVRFGRVHLYNNFYNAPGNNNCIRAARDSEILVENNYFDTVKNVWELYRTVGLDGKVFATNNIEVNTTWSAGSDSSSIQIPGTDILSNAPNGLNPLPYPYTLTAANLIPNLVTNGAGAGKGPFAP